MTLTIDIPPSIESDLVDAAKRKGVSLEDYILSKLTENSEAATSDKQPDSWDHLMNLANEFKDSMPEEEWNRLPSDYATNFQEYRGASQQKSQN